MAGHAVPPPAQSAWHWLSTLLTCSPGPQDNCFGVGWQTVPTLGTFCFDQPA
jgi:hypothetical protein